jgi:hypothetical protein
MPPRHRPAATVGVAEHGNAAILVTLSDAGHLLDRRRVELTEGLPTHPYHHEGSWAIGRYADSPWARPITLDAAIRLVERVHEAADIGARQSLEALAQAIRLPITRIALRACPELPDTIVDRIMDTRAATVADSVLYRRALATAAEKRGWRVHWYRPDDVYTDAANAVRVDDIDDLLKDMGRAVGPPWQARHKLAAAAALAFGGPSLPSDGGETAS